MLHVCDMSDNVTATGGFCEQFGCKGLRFLTGKTCMVLLYITNL